MINKIIKLIRELHQNPELSGLEAKTAIRIKLFFELHQPTEIIENLGSFSLADIYEFSTNGPTIEIRCELDALPITF